MNSQFSPLGSLNNPTIPPSGIPRFGGGFGTPGQDTALAPTPSLQVFPWWVYPPPASQYYYVDTYDVAGVSQVILAGSQNVPMVGSTLVVGLAERAVIVSIALVVQSPTATDNYFFTLLRNGGPVEGLRQLRNFSVVANASVREYNGYAIKLEPGDEVSWTCTNNGPANVSVAINYQGWRTSVNEIERLQGGKNL